MLSLPGYRCLRRLTEMCEPECWGTNAVIIGSCQTLITDPLLFCYECRQPTAERRHGPHLGGVRVGGAGGLGDGEAHVGDRPVRDADAVDQLLRRLAQHPVHPAGSGAVELLSSPRHHPPSAIILCLFVL